MTRPLTIVLTPVEANAIANLLRIEVDRYNLVEGYAIFDVLRKIEAASLQPSDACEGCGASDCSHLWPDQRKCCPDCTHSSQSSEPS